MTSVTPSSDIIIRHARPQDVESICKMLRATFTITFGYSLSDEDLNAYLDEAYNVPAINAELANPAMTSIVAENPTQQSEIIGFTQLLRGSSEAEPSVQNVEKAVEMHRLYVDTNFQKRGVGKRLINEVERIAKEEGFLVMWLGVWEDHPYARDMYRKWGYERCGKHPFRQGNCIQYDWVVKKTL